MIQRQKVVLRPVHIAPSCLWFFSNLRDLEQPPGQPALRRTCLSHRAHTRARYGRGHAHASSWSATRTKPAPVWHVEIFHIS